MIEGTPIMICREKAGLGVIFRLRGDPSLGVAVQMDGDFAHLRVFDPGYVNIAATRESGMCMELGDTHAPWKPQ
jgi:hypothetical protein